MGKSAYRPISKYEQHEINPYAPEAIETMRVKKRTTMVHATKRQAIHQMEVVDKVTGEVSDIHTTFFNAKIVDEAQFVKVFTDELRILWDLSKPAMRVLTYVMSALRINQDSIMFDLADCRGYTGYKSERSIFYGLGELIENGIIARTTKPYMYFINPMIVFNGNRVTFARTYIKTRKRKENPDQLKLFDEPKQLEGNSDEQPADQSD